MSALQVLPTPSLLFFGGLEGVLYNTTQLEVLTWLFIKFAIAIRSPTFFRFDNHGCILRTFPACIFLHAKKYGISLNEVFYFCYDRTCMSFLILSGRYTAVSVFEIFLLFFFFFSVMLSWQAVLFYAPLSPLERIPLTFCCCFMFYKTSLTLKSYSQYQNNLCGTKNMFNFK